MGIAWQDIGSDTGPLQHIYIGADGAFQVRHSGNSDYQFNPPASSLGDAGTFMEYGLLYHPDFPNHDSTDTPGFGGSDWDMNAQSVVMTANGVSRVITTLQTLGDDITLTVVDTYVSGQNCWRTDYIIQNNYTAAAIITLYRGADAYLNGSNSGYGVTRAGGVVGVAANAGNDPVGNAIWFVPMVADQYFEGTPASLWTLIDDVDALPNTVVAGSGDAALALAWALTLPAKSVAVRSCLTQVQVAEPVVPPTLDAWHFRGFCYRGADGDTATPLGGVTLRLYVGSTSTFASATLKRTTVSDGGGFWNFFEDQEYNYYWVEAVTPGGMTATGSATGDGTIISDTLLRWGSGPARGVHAGNEFFAE